MPEDNPPITCEACGSDDTSIHYHEPTAATPEGTSIHCHNCNHTSDPQ